MIQGFIGRPGYGKTYSVVEKALRLAEKQKKDLYANCPIEGAKEFGPHDFIELGPGIVVLDEVHLWLPARASMRVPPSWVQLLSQTRKRGWTILWTAQSEKNVDVLLRRVTNHLWLTKPIGRWHGHPIVFRQEAWHTDEFRKPGLQVASRWLFYKARVAQAYDTMAQIDAATHYLKGTDPYARKEP